MSSSFKSHRCGIETSRSGVSPCYSYSNRTVAGLKRGPFTSTTGGSKFKSHRCGIETPEQPRRPDIRRFKSHRCGIETEARQAALRKTFHSNRTVAGLKLLVRVDQTPCLVFKSHRCGIETATHAHRSSARFKSHRCGIETSQGKGPEALRANSNRTVAGLKRIRRRGCSRPTQIQIAPLRD